MNPPILLTGSEGISLKVDYEQALLEMLLRKRLKQLQRSVHQKQRNADSCGNRRSIDSGGIHSVG